MPSKVRMIRFRNGLSDSRSRFPGKINKILEANVKGGVVLLKGIMPRDTGDMIESTEAAPSGKGWGIKIGVDYWRHVNDGTIYIEGQHFMERAVESIKAGVDRDLRTLNLL